VFGVWPETLVTPAPQREQSLGTRCDRRCPTVEWRRELACVLILALTCCAPVGSFVFNERGSSSSASLSEGQTFALLGAATSPRGSFARSRRGTAPSRVVHPGVVPGAIAFRIGRAATGHQANCGLPLRQSIRTVSVRGPPPRDVTAKT